MLAQPLQPQPGGAERVEDGAQRMQPVHLAPVDELRLRVGVVARIVNQQRLAAEIGHVPAGPATRVHAGHIVEDQNGRVGVTVPPGPSAPTRCSSPGARVIGTARGAEVDRVRELGADEAIDVDAVPFEAAVAAVGAVDVVVDLVGGEVQTRSLEVLGPGGVLVSAVSEPDRDGAARRGVRASFMLVDVTGAALVEVARLLDEGRLRAGDVGEVLPLEQAVLAHRMLEGEEPHRRGKIVLRVAAA